MTKEWEEVRRAQEERAAADLKAKLDMVHAVKRGSYDQTLWRGYAHGRLPKRVGEIVCETGIKKKYGYDERISFPLRLDAHKGVFIAEHGDMLYVSTSKEALQLKMNEVAKVKIELRWTRYLEIDYSAFGEQDLGAYNHKGSLGLEKKRYKKQRIDGVRLEWKVVDYSDAFTMPGTTGEEPQKRYMTRSVSDKKEEDDERVVDSLPKLGLVVHTEEREQLLVQVQAALKAIDGKLYELLRGKPEEVGARIDGMTLPQLMSGDGT